MGFPDFLNPFSDGPNVFNPFGGTPLSLPGLGGSDSTFGSLSDWSKSMTGSTAAEQYKENMQFNREQFDYSKQWNQQQMDFQREQYEYQKALQQQQQMREDTAYQRAASDMRAAGLNPLSGVNPAQASVVMPSAASPGTVSAPGAPSATSSSSAASLSDVVSAFTGIYGAFANRAFQKDSLQQAAVIAAARNEESSRHNKAIETILNKNASTSAKSAAASVLRDESQTGLNEALTGKTNLETKMRGKAGYLPDAPESVKTVKEALNAASDVANALQLESRDVATGDEAFDFWTTSLKRLPRKDGNHVYLYNNKGYTLAELKKLWSNSQTLRSEWSARLRGDDKAVRKYENQGGRPFGR